MRRFTLLAIALLSLSLMAFTGVHKFYVSVTNVEYAPKEESLQIISRIFIDDLDNALQTRYDFNGNLATPEEDGKVDAYIERYFNSKFSVFINETEREYTFVGKRYDNDLVICYLEVTGLPETELRSIGIQNEILTDIFEEQKNLVHIKALGKKKSYVLIRENNKGMLNF